MNSRQQNTNHESRFQDQPTERIRDGETLDTERLAAYLRTNLADLDGRLSIRQFPAGYSNLTYLLSFHLDETEAPPRQFVLRRPPVGNTVKSAHDMSREFRVLSKLAPVYAAAPRPFLFCDDETVIGCPFYVMQRCEGIILRRTLPDGLDVSDANLTELSKAFTRQLADLHQLDFESIGLGDLGRPEGYVQRQVSGWTRRYQAAATSELPDVDFVANWLATDQPTDNYVGLLHNDFKFDNLVLAIDDITRIDAVLDWEMATVGDTLMDLGSSLAYWIDPDDSNDLRAWAFGITDRRGCLNRQEMADHYLQLRRISIESRSLLFYYVYGLFKLIGIVQQIYSRFDSGLTADPRFAKLDEMVAALGRQARRAITTERISQLTP